MSDKNCSQMAYQDTHQNLMKFKYLQYPQPKSKDGNAQIFTFQYYIVKIKKPLLTITTVTYVGQELQLDGISRYTLELNEV